MVISLATNESSCEWGQRRTRLAKNGSESHFSNLSLSCREKGFRVLGTRVQRFWTLRGFLTFSLFFSLVRGYFFFFFFWPFKFQIFFIFYFDPSYLNFLYIWPSRFKHFILVIFIWLSFLFGDKTENFETQGPVRNFKIENKKFLNFFHNSFIKFFML